MKKHYSFPKIGQYPQMTKSITHTFRYEGIDENEQIIYNNKPLPKLKWSGSIKTHGTNIGIAQNSDRDIWIQSRSQIKTNGHFQSVLFINTNIEIFKTIFENIRKEFAKDFRKEYDDLTIVIFGEWAGGNIQKGVGISKITTPFLYGFDVKLISETEQFTNFYEDKYLKHLQDQHEHIYTKFQFPTYIMEIDFNNPQLFQNKLIALTDTIEKRCPVADALLQDFVGDDELIGEGIVWRYNSVKTGCLRFKVKGEKHQTSGKVKSLKSIDQGKLEAINAFAVFAATVNRVEQAVFEAIPEGEVASRANTGDVLRWVANDIIKEETDNLNAQGLEWKDVSNKTSAVARTIFFDILDDLS